MMGERPLSWNKFYSGVHHTQRSVVKRLKRAVLNEALSRKQMEFRYEQPVKVHVKVYFGKGVTIDADNIFVKPYIDELVGVGILKDDDIRYVSSVQVSAYKHKDEAPRVEVHITPDTQKEGKK